MNYMKIYYNETGYMPKIEQFISAAKEMADKFKMAYVVIPSSYNEVIILPITVGPFYTGLNLTSIS